MARTPSPTARTRKRRPSLTVDRAEVFERVKKFFDMGIAAHDTSREIRLQRYAKLRMWTEGKDWPWPNASDIPLPDILEKSLRTQDTIHNAVMSTRPPISPTALNPADKEREEVVDKLIDHQIFVEQNGEKVVGDLADAYTNDGVFTAFIPWVKEFREVSDVIKHARIPDEVLPREHFRAILRQQFPEMRDLEEKSNGWDYEFKAVEESGGDLKHRVSFFTDDRQRVEMVIQKEAKVYDGPRVIVKDYEDVIHPPRCENLQPPSPSNPHGAPHVILVDHPTVDEVMRLHKSKFYDLMTNEEANELGTRRKSPQGIEDEEEEQRDVFEGANEDMRPDFAREQNKLTRLLCFDIFDLDNDGIAEDVIFWVLLEPKLVVKAKLLTEMFPSNPPRRPFAEATFLPVRGRRLGISLPELVEPLHDAWKTILDQSIDAGTITNAPFFFYRQTGSVKPEVLTLSPGEGYPVGDPQRDVQFPKIGDPQAQAFGLNLSTMISQMEERLAVIGSFQFGQVPAGQSTALRTIGGMAMLAGQGEARPERILRRFFSGLSEIWAQIHELNQVFLPRNKVIRISGGLEKSKDPFVRIAGASAIKGRFQFTFSANVFNTSKMALQQSLGALIGLYTSPIALQAGLVDQGGIYRLYRDFGKAFGQDADKYIKAPHPMALKRPIFATEVIQSFLQGTPTDGRPAEPGGAQEHLEVLQQFMSSDDFGFLDRSMAAEFGVYLRAVQRLAALEARQQDMVDAAARSQGGAERAGPGRPAEQLPSDLSNPPVSSGAELLDETLPGAGGGTVQ